MTPTTLLDRFVSLISTVFKLRPPKQRIVVFNEAGDRRDEFVSNPVTFSELNELFGEGNWALPSE